MYERSFTVEEVEARERLDHFLERRLEGVSRGHIRRAILEGAVTINGEHRESGRRLRAGDRIEVRLDEAPRLVLVPEAIPLRVLFEDAHMLAVDKPSGMFAHPTSRVHSGTLLNAALYHTRHDSRERGARPLLVHRLDRATSGVLVLSKTPRAQQRLAKTWHDRRVRKRYLALVCGAMPAPEGTIDAPIGGTRDRTPGFRVMESGRPAQTHFRTLAIYGPFTLVELEPLTGRTNQLRIHTAHVGAPIAGDDLHGQPELDAFRRLHPEAVMPDRLFLHAAALELEHPDSGEPLTIEAPLPAELVAHLDEVARRYR